MTQDIRTVRIATQGPAGPPGSGSGGGGGAVSSVAGRTGAVTLAAADISGLAASATTDATNAGNIGSGTLSNARLSGVALSANNLSDLASAATARGNLGLAGIAASGSAADISAGILGSARGGTGNGFAKFAGPASSEKTFTLPDSNATLLAADKADQTISGGANVTATSLGAGSITVDCGKCPLQYITNGDAFTVTAPVNDGSCMLLVSNNASAGVITFSGFSVGATGDTLDTTNGHKFSLSIWRINGVAGYRVAAHQ